MSIRSSGSAVNHRSSDSGEAVQPDSASKNANAWTMRANDAETYGGYLMVMARFRKDAPNVARATGGGSDFDQHWRIHDRKCPDYGRIMCLRRRRRLVPDLVGGCPRFDRAPRMTAQEGA